MYMYVLVLAHKLAGRYTVYILYTETCVCVNIHVYIYIHTYMFVDLSIYVFICLCIYIYMYIVYHVNVQYVQIVHSFRFLFTHEQWSVVS